MDISIWLNLSSHYERKPQFCLYLDVKMLDPDPMKSTETAEKFLDGPKKSVEINKNEKSESEISENSKSSENSSAAEMREFIKNRGRKVGKKCIPNRGRWTKEWYKKQNQLVNTEDEETLVDQTFNKTKTYYSCMACSKTFYRKKSLLIHLRQGLKLEPFFEKAMICWK
jgi:CRISPR/Cas system CSM-associated protein Csm5 (group 7 of RAMP superfamily)